MDDLRKTPLHMIQQLRGARFVPFVGWDMPVQFSGVVKEHQAVRTKVGLFDVSHMGEIMVEGPQAAAALQLIVTNDVTKLRDGRAQYTVMCRDDGGIVDDLIVYRETAERFFLCVNAGRRADDFAHLREHATRFRCQIRDVSEDFAQMALQGPAAIPLLEELTQGATAALAPFDWLDREVAGVQPVRIARTGYTGEAGFELYCASSVAEKLWRALEEAGEKYGLTLCGLGARDTLRLEMKYPLYGNDIDLQHNPLEAGLGWVVKFDKGNFIGRSALQKIKTDTPQRRWVGFKMQGRGIPRPGYPIYAAGQAVGMVTSGTHSPTLGEPIGCGYVPTSLAAVGSVFEIIIRDKPVAAYVVKTPFVKRDN